MKRLLLAGLLVAGCAHASPSSDCKPFANDAGKRYDLGKPYNIQGHALSRGAVMCVIRFHQQNVYGQNITHFATLIANPSNGQYELENYQ